MLRHVALTPIQIAILIVVPMTVAGVIGSIFNVAIDMPTITLLFGPPVLGTFLILLGVLAKLQGESLYDLAIVIGIGSSMILVWLGWLLVLLFVPAHPL